MEPRLNVIPATLQAFGVEFSVRLGAQHSQVQDAVYLAQETGVDFGYNFTWLDTGPYSKHLSDDYYDAVGIAEATQVGRRPLAAPFARRLEILRDVLTSPHGVPPEQWLGLLALVHFLHKQENEPEPSSGAAAVLRAVADVGTPVIVERSATDTAPLRMPDLQTGKVPHDHLAHIAANFWVGACAFCWERWTSLGRVWEEEYAAWVAAGKPPGKPRCRACLGENRT